MFELKAFSTIETLIASVILLIVLSISTTLIVNLYSTSVRNSQFNADTIVMKMALNHDSKSHIKNFVSNGLRVETILSETEYNDVQQIIYRIYDLQGQNIKELSIYVAKD